MCRFIATLVLVISIVEGDISEDLLASANTIGPLVITRKGLVPPPK